MSPELLLFALGVITLLPYGLPLALAGGSLLAGMAPGLLGALDLALTGRLSLGNGDQALVEALAANWSWGLAAWGGLLLWVVVPEALEARWRALPEEQRKGLPRWWPAWDVATVWLRVWPGEERIRFLGTLGEVCPEQAVQALRTALV